jgi:hypothetical protein
MMSNTRNYNVPETIQNKLIQNIKLKINEKLYELLDEQINNFDILNYVSIIAYKISEAESGIGDGNEEQKKDKQKQEDLKFINQAIYDYIDDDECLTFHQKFQLDLDCSKEDHVQFIRTCKNVQFPSYDTLIIENISSLDKSDM